MGEPTRAIKEWFLRGVYAGAAAEGLSRPDYIAAKAANFQETLFSGMDLVGNSGGGVSASYGERLTVEQRARLFTWALGYISEEDVEDAIASIPRDIRSIRPHFGCMAY